MRSAWSAAFVSVVVGCTSIVGLDGDYTVGDSPSTGGAGQGAGTSAGGSSTGGSSTGGDATGGASAGGASAGGSSAGGAGGASQGGGGAGGSPPVLDDTGLMVRYYLDEGSAGAASGQVDDASGNGFHLTIQDGGNNVTWDTVSGQRGLLFASGGSSGQAFRDVTGTAVTTAFDGQTDVTIEAVIANPTDPSSGNGRMLVFGDDGSTEAFAFGLNPGAVAEIRMNGGDRGRFPLNAFVSDQRIVLHAVIDTTLGTQAERTKVYMDGVELGTTYSAAGASETFGMGTTMFVVIGNRRPDNRSFGGSLQYVALYDHAFVPATITSHAAILANSDDTP